MTFGNGGIIRNNKIPQSGPPFQATSANNGLSVDPVSGKIVLGSDTNTTDAQLLSNRDIDTGTGVGIFSLRFTRSAFGQDFRTSIFAGGIIFENSFQSGIRFQGGINLSEVNLIYNDGFRRLEIGCVPTAQRFDFDFDNNGFRTPATGTVGGSGLWQLGRLTAGAVAMNPNLFVEVCVDGSPVKLLVAV